MVIPASAYCTVILATSARKDKVSLVCVVIVLSVAVDQHICMPYTTSGCPLSVSNLHQSLFLWTCNWRIFIHLVDSCLFLRFMCIYNICFIPWNVSFSNYTHFYLSILLKLGFPLCNATFTLQLLLKGTVKNENFGIIWKALRLGQQRRKG